MTFLDYLHLLRRNKVSVLMVTLLITVTTMGLVMYKNRFPYQSTVFVTIGNTQKNTAGETPVYDNVQASDHFSETVQGWFKNPEFQKRTSLEGVSELSARKQEKQNLLITFSGKNRELSEKMSGIVQTELQREIDTYNTKTAGSFQMAIFSGITEEKPLSAALFLVISLIGGIILSSFAIYGYEYSLQKVSSPMQASAITKKDAIDRIWNLKTGKDKLQFLSSYLNTVETKTVQIIGAGVETDSFAKTLDGLTGEKTVHNVNFPRESGKIVPQNHHVVVCSLGKTTIEDLRKLQTVLSGSFDLIIAEA